MARRGRGGAGTRFRAKVLRELTPGRDNHAPAKHPHLVSKDDTRRGIFPEVRGQRTPVLATVLAEPAVVGADLVVLAGDHAPVPPACASTGKCHGPACISWCQGTVDAWQRRPRTGGPGTWGSHGDS